MRYGHRLARMRIASLAAIAVAGCGDRTPLDGTCSFNRSWTCTAPTLDASLIAPSCPSGIEVGSVSCLAAPPMPNDPGDTPYLFTGCFACPSDGVGTLWSCDCASSATCEVAQNLMPHGTFACAP
jgi:hypothetical protein